MTTPPILQEIRRVRQEISAEIGHDPKRIREYYAALQASVKSRTINLADQGVGGQAKQSNEVADGSSKPSAR
jgi:hypothetical protein